MEVENEADADLTHVDRRTFTLTDTPCSSDKVNAMYG